MFFVIRRKHLALAGWLLLFLCIMLAVFWQGRRKDVASFAANSFHPSTVIIDPGHGGEDGGAVATDGTVESTLNLEISLRLNDLLRLFGQETEMTRREDVSIYSPDAHTLHEKKVSDLQNRVAMVNGTENAVLLSIHQNKLPMVPSVHGAQVFYNSVSGGADLAKSIQSSLNNCVNLDNEKSEKPASSTIYLMKNITAPAVLVECGFLSNPKETAALKSRDSQLQLATAITAGYLNCISAGEEGK